MKLKPLAIALCAVLAAGVIAAALLAPGTLEAKRVLDIEKSATPTPTADIRSMLMVTPDPNVTPAPTPYLLKPASRATKSPSCSAGSRSWAITWARWTASTAPAPKAR